LKPRIISADFLIPLTKEIMGNKMKMKIKIIVLLLVLSAVLFSGCAGTEQPSPEENATPEETVTPEEIETPEETETPVETETETPEEVETPAATEPEEEITPGEDETENETEEGPVVTTPGIRESPYVIRLDNYIASPSSLNIKEGETVAWINYHDSPKRSFTLISEQDLFEDANLVYGRSFVYTFNETGDYNFTVAGQPRMSVNITVSEP
jgi:plastocyanin